jgi:hypothetical protein
MMIGPSDFGAAATVLRAFPRVSPRRRAPRTTPAAPDAFREIMQRQCAELASAVVTTKGNPLGNKAAQAQHGHSTAIDLAAIVLELIACGSSPFACRPHGRIVVWFRATADGLELTVEHIGPTNPAARGQAIDTATLEKWVVSQPGGRHECPIMFGATRTIVTMPRR